MAKAIVKRIDSAPDHSAVLQAKTLCERWLSINPCVDLVEWQSILSTSWDSIRKILLDPSEQGNRLRQSNPFCGVLRPKERWAIYKHFNSDE